MYRVIVAGGRYFNNYDLLKNKLDRLKNKIGNFYVVCGKAKGADTLGEKWAIENNCDVLYFPANWDKYGKSAGVIRNEEMAKNGNILIAFWDKKSKGTLNMINVAKKYKLPTKIVYYE